MQLREAMNIKSQRVITFVGGGGKTSTLLALANELLHQGNKVIITTTTRMGAGEVAFYPQALGESLGEVIAKLKKIQTGKSLVVVGQEIKNGKLLGVPPQWVDELALHFPESFLLIEGDGAAKKPFKAPAAHEPVIPSSTQKVVGVVGVDALGVPLAEANIHRPQLVSALTGLALGELTTPGALAQVIMHEQGYRKNLPSQAELVVLINKVETQEQLRKAEALAQCLMDAGCSLVILGAIKRKKVWGIRRR